MAAGTNCSHTPKPAHPTSIELPQRISALSAAKNLRCALPKGSTTFTFVTEGMESAVKQAGKAAGRKNVYLMGGAKVAQQCIKAGLVEEMMIHLVPVLLGDGIRLFGNLESEQIELERTKLVAAPGVTHLKYRVVKL